MKEVSIHLVSDSTGETVSSVMRSIMAQFNNVEVEEHMWSLVRTSGQMENVIAEISKNPSIVMCTIAEEKLLKQLKEECRKLKIPCISILSRFTKEISSYIGVEAEGSPGKQHELDEEYFTRVEAVNFTLSHDDGQGAKDLEEADIVLVGVSRTSKTPTCVYLSYRGIYAANVPFVKGIPLPGNLESLKKPLVVGLVINPERLIQIRKSRLVSLNEERETEYVDIEHIKEEIREARIMFNKNKWPILDVTRRSIEETTAAIMQLYNTHKASLEAKND